LSLPAVDLVDRRGDVDRGRVDDVVDRRDRQGRRRRRRPLPDLRLEVGDDAIERRAQGRLVEIGLRQPDRGARLPRRGPRRVAARRGGVALAPQLLEERLGDDLVVAQVLVALQVARRLLRGEAGLVRRRLGAGDLLPGELEAGAQVTVDDAQEDLALLHRHALARPDVFHLAAESAG